MHDLPKSTQHDWQTELDDSSPGDVDDGTSAWDIVAASDNSSPSPKDFARKGSVETRKGDITPYIIERLAG